MTVDLEIVESVEDLAQRAAQFFVDHLDPEAQRLSVCLSGGNTPRALYHLIAQEPFRSELPLARIHWFFGDERFVPWDDPRSNFRMAQEELFNPAAVVPSHVHPMPTQGLTLNEAAQAYEADLRKFYGAQALSADRPLFDLMLLGLGEDGHTASLFPGDPALDKRIPWVTEVANAPQAPRLTLTLPAILSSRHILFLVSGAGKREALKKLVAGDPTIPAAHVQGPPVHIFADRAAAG